MPSLFDKLSCATDYDPDWDPGIFHRSSEEFACEFDCPTGPMIAFSPRVIEIVRTLEASQPKEAINFLLNIIAFLTRDTLRMSTEVIYPPEGLKANTVYSLEERKNTKQPPGISAYLSSNSSWN